MVEGGLFDVNKQLVFYGSHHANKVNVLAHQLCVPLLVLTAQAMFAALPTPSFFPSCHYTLSPYLVFDFNWATVAALIYLIYYFLLFPAGAVTYAPQGIATLLLANRMALEQAYMPYILGTHILCWLAQFYTHAVYEKRRPSLVDNLTQALILAPFFVHLEGLFSLGFFPDLQKSIHSDIRKKIAEFKKQEEGKKERAKS